MEGVRSHNEGSIWFRRSRRCLVATVTMRGSRRESRLCPHRDHKPADRPCREVRALLQELLDRRDAGTGDPRKIRVGPFLESWVSRVQGLAPSTVRQHEQIIRNHLVPNLGRLTLFELTRDDVNAYLSRTDLDGRTLRHHRATLRRALRDAERDGILSRNAASLSAPPRLPRKERVTLTADQVRTLLDGTAGDRLHALWTVGATLGLRLGEALGLVWSDIDWQRRTVTVRYQLGRDAAGWARVSLKTDKSHRTIPLPPRTLRALEQHRDIQDRDRRDVPKPIDGYVFLTADGHPIHGPNVLPPLYRALARLELPRVTFHSLRHSAATILLRERVPLPTISAILGHSTIRVTADIYAHVLDESMQDAADVMERAVG
jgi:integrase